MTSELDASEVDDFTGVPDGDREGLAGRLVDSFLHDNFSIRFDTLFSGIARIDILFDFGCDLFEDGAEKRREFDTVLSVKSLVTL